MANLFSNKINNKGELIIKMRNEKKENYDVRKIKINNQNYVLTELNVLQNAANFLIETLNSNANIVIKINDETPIFIKSSDVVYCRLTTARFGFLGEKEIENQKNLELEETHFSFTE